ncbi:MULTISPECIES: hypothetical protein [Arthrobacter]|uniref:Lipoprotein n=1 Tax=Arthrobacter terricola TaxID=2547396 RepID=A0A4R5KJT9_9MICC|nr:MULTISPECIES: hypothetical protein [Arthrobacter]MBT8161532.1 hypothetical protein [Arthrobacter sp. GN70]TDF95696.1 hypothetical protein E1809_11820 [Arthrobacter terricola]
MGAKRIPLSFSIAVLAAVVAIAAAGCSADGKAGSTWTAGTSTAPGPSGAGAVPPSGASGSPSASAGASSPSAGAATSGATAAAWKTYTDAAKTVSFDLPSDWIAQSLAPDAGTLPGALKIVVKDSKGTYMATLETGLPAASPAACDDAAKRPYVVVSSVPVDLPHADSDSTIPPHVVFRVIQGYKFFGSYGITNMVAGTDGKACELRNLVAAPAGKGNYSFGDMSAIHAFATDEVVAPAKSFDTLDQAAKYVDDSSEFANVQRMLLSLKVNL